MPEEGFSLTFGGELLLPQGIFNDYSLTETAAVLTILFLSSIHTNICIYLTYLMFAGIK